MKLEEIETQSKKLRRASEIGRTINSINYTLEKAKEANTDCGLIDVQIGSVGAAGIKVSKEVALKLLLGEKERLEKELEEI